MDIPRKIGSLIFCGVPVIIGGGIVYAITDSYMAVGVFEALVLAVAGGILSR